MSSAPWGHTGTAPNQKCLKMHSQPQSHLLQLVIQDVGAHVGHDLPAGGVLGALGGVQFVQVAETDVVALADGVQVLHVAVREKSLELVAAIEGIAKANGQRPMMVRSIDQPPRQTRRGEDR